MSSDQGPTSADKGAFGFLVVRDNSIYFILSRVTAWKRIRHPPEPYRWPQNPLLEHGCCRFKPGVTLKCLRAVAGTLYVAVRNKPRIPVDYICPITPPTSHPQRPGHARSLFHLAPTQVAHNCCWLGACENCLNRELNYSRAGGQQENIEVSSAGVLQQLISKLISLFITQQLKRCQ